MAPSRRFARDAGVGTEDDATAVASVGATDAGAVWSFCCDMKEVQLWVNDNDVESPLWVPESIPKQVLCREHMGVERHTVPRFVVVDKFTTL